MMKNRPGEKIKLASLDEFLGVVNEESAMEIEINKSHAFKNHPFKVLEDEKMEDLVDSNIQREELLPSEKAFALRMKLEAMKRQGTRTDLSENDDVDSESNMTSAQNERRLEAADIIG